MGEVSTNIYKQLLTYWNRRSYHKLSNNNVIGCREGPGHANPDHPSRKRKRRFFRVKIGRRIRIWNRVGSSKKWLNRVRDGYVKMMMSFGNTGGIGGGTEYGVSSSVKEYDEKVIVEIYKSFVMGQTKIVRP